MSGASQDNGNRTNLEANTAGQGLTQEFIDLRAALGAIGIVVNPEAHDLVPTGQSPLQFSQGALRLMAGPAVDVTGACLEASNDDTPVPGPTPTSPGRLGRIFSTPGANDPKGDDKKDE